MKFRLRAAAACDAAIFITGPLAELCGAGIAGKPRQIIPTAASEDLFFFDTTLRETVRTSLGFQPNHRVFVYSGSLTSRHRIDEIADVFASIHRADRDTRLLVVTPDKTEPRLAKLDQQSVVVLTASLAEVNKYLNAADAAFMLRQTTPVNAVALPTKFAEYCLTGLPVIMTEAVPEACHIATKLGNWAVLDGDRIRWPPAFRRADVALRAAQLLGKRHLAPMYDALYRNA